MLAGVPGFRAQLVYERVSGFSVTQWCFWKGSERTGLFLLSDLHSCLRSKLTCAADMSISCEKRESQQKTECYNPYQCPTASHWSADSRWRQNLLFLCSFVLWFKLEPLTKGFCWSGKPSECGKVYSSFLQTSNLSLCVCVIGTLHFSFLIYSHSPFSAVMFLTKKEAIGDGVFSDPKSPLGQFRLRGFTSWHFLLWAFPYILETLGTHSPHPFFFSLSGIW